jgi:hypothetical protein
MAINHNRWKVVAVHGVVDLEHIRRGIVDPNEVLFLSKAWLVDAQHAEFALSGAEVNILAETTKGLFRVLYLGRIAIVVRGQLEYGLVRMFAIMVSDVISEIRPFYDMQEAEVWLDA